MEGRDAHRVAQTQIVELIELRRGLTGGIQLVHGQHDGLFCPLEHGGHLLIGGGDAGADIGDQNDHLGVVDGDQRLLAHELQNFIIGFGLDAAGVHQNEGLSAPFCVTVNAVAGDAGGVLHDGVPLFGNAVEQQGFAHIGPTDHGDDGFFHSISSLFSLIVSALIGKIKHIV